MRYPVYDEYRPSRYDASINLPSNWQEKRLKFVASHNDETLSEKTDPDYLIEYIDISSVDLVNGITRIESVNFDSAPSRARRIVRDGDTIVSTVRTYLKSIATIKEPPDNMVVSTGFVVIRPKDEINKKYLSYFLQSQGFVDSVVAHSVGVSYPAINASDLVCLPVSYPTSVIEQQKIANFLDYKTQQIDRLIEKKKELIEKLNEQRIAVITQAVTKGIDKNAKMKASGVGWLGDVPEHWEVKLLKFVASYNDETLPETTDPDKEISYVEISSVNYVDGITKIELTTFEKAPSRARRVVRDGDTIISTVRTYLKAIASIVTPPDNMIVSTGFAVIRATDIINADFLSFFLSNQKFVETVVAHSKGVSYPAINASELCCIHIAFPESKIEQESIVNYIGKSIGKIDEMFNLNTKAIERLKEYRTSIIAASVTGKINVRDVNVGTSGH